LVQQFVIFLPLSRRAITILSLPNFLTNFLLCAFTCRLVNYISKTVAILLCILRIPFRKFAGKVKLSLVLFINFKGPLLQLHTNKSKTFKIDFFSGMRYLTKNHFKVTKSPAWDNLMVLNFIVTLLHVINVWWLHDVSGCGKL